MEDKNTKRAADNIRTLSVAMVEQAQSGHPGGAMGAAEFMHVLYSEFLNFDPDDMTWKNRDRFFLDPGHMSPLLYATLSFTGAFSMDDIKQFRQWDSHTPGHPELYPERGIENTSGPLGQGHTYAVGAAIAEKFLEARFGEWMSHNIYTLVSDGGIQEEISQGAGRLAGYLGLSNLVLFYDSNQIQLSTRTDVVTDEDTKKKYEAWGWRVKRIDGHDTQQIREALQEAKQETERPFLIIGDTVMGKGAVTEDGESFEYQVAAHGQPLSSAGASPEKTIEKLGGDPNNPFQIYSDVKEHYDKVLREKREMVAQKRKEEEKWRKNNPELAKKWDAFMSGEVPSIDYSAVKLKANDHTRGASGNVLSQFAKDVENIIVATADLSPSDKTAGFLKNDKPFEKGNFAGRFLQAGVSELTMAAVSSGIALHGGVFVICGTFFVFSDYMKPVMRMASLMELPVKYIFSHDSFRVGEDGPTHQPVEQEAQLRLLEKLKNHSGQKSILALRPADGNETVVAWEMAMNNQKTPSALIFSRQGVKDIPAYTEESRYQEAVQAKKGGYIVKQPAGEPDVVLIANGSEVSTLIEATETLEKEYNLKVQISSVISEGLFREQDMEYQRKVIPWNYLTIGLTAGLYVSLAELTGPNGFVFGFNSFGYSGNYKVLNEKFGYTGENVARMVKQVYDEFKSTQ